MCLYVYRVGPDARRVQMSVLGEAHRMLLIDLFRVGFDDRRGLMGVLGGVHCMLLIDLFRVGPDVGRGLMVIRKGHCMLCMLLVVFVTLACDF